MTVRYLTLRWLVPTILTMPTIIHLITTVECKADSIMKFPARLQVQHGVRRALKPFSHCNKIQRRNRYRDGIGSCSKVSTMQRKHIKNM